MQHGNENPPSRQSQPVFPLDYRAAQKAEPRPPHHASHVTHRISCIQAEASLRRRRFQPPETPRCTQLGSSGMRTHTEKRPPSSDSRFYARVLCSDTGSRPHRLFAERSRGRERAGRCSGAITFQQSAPRASRFDRCPRPRRIRLRSRAERPSARSPCGEPP